MKITTLRPTAAPRYWPFFCLVMFAICFMVSLIIPSFQAPDEYDHINRAYMLSQGHITLHSVNGSPSGGEVDEGLLEYAGYFKSLKGNANIKLSEDESLQAAAVPWAGQSLFVTAVGTSYYFPALYFPQALGLATGKTLHLSVGQSYRLARLLTLAACFTLLCAAFRIFQPPTLILALLALPMNIFLLASPVLDGMAICVTIVALSTFMRVLSDGRQAAVRWIYILALSVAAVAACRANLLPLLILPFAGWWITRTKPAFVCAVLTFLLVLGWTIYTIKVTVYPPGARNVDHGARLIGFLIHPGTFGQIVLATLTNSAIFNFYAVSFIGVLGWLDAPFSSATYTVLIALLSLVTICSISARAIESYRWTRILLLLCSLGAVLLTFLALLVQWTVGPATVVDGVQGRYFTIPVIIAAYALFANPKPLAGFADTARTALTVVLLTFSTYVTGLLLINRYYMQDVQPDPKSLIVLSPSDSLTHDRAIPLHFSPYQITTPDELDRISLRFGTYMTKHSGQAALILHTGDNHTLRVPFNLAELSDNAYKEFELDGKRYIRGEIVSEGGEGISTYQAKSGDAAVVDCMLTRARSERVAITPGCPLP